MKDGSRAWVGTVYRCKRCKEIREGEEMTDKTGEWWCPGCQMPVPPEHVTFEEYHDQCGHKVRWIEPNATDCPRCASLAAERDALKEEVGQIDIVFDAAPGRECGRFVEVENSEGESISFGEWIHREDGYWVLRFRAALSRLDGRKG